MRTDKPMVVDCDTCPVRDVHCDDCLVTALRALPVGPVSRVTDDALPLDAGEQRAVQRFVAAGLVGADQASMLAARREPWSRVRAVG